MPDPNELNLSPGAGGWQWPPYQLMRLAPEPSGGTKRPTPRKRGSRRKTGAEVGLEPDQLLALLQRHFRTIRPAAKGSISTERAVLAALIQAPRGRHGRAITMREIAQQVVLCPRRTRAVLEQLEGFGLVRRICKELPGTVEIDIAPLCARLQAASEVAR